MSSRHQPPVNEVVLSVGLQPQDALIGPRLPEILGDWFEEFPDIVTVPPYEMPPEPRGVNKPRPSFFPAFEIHATTPRPRYWLTAADKPYLLQVQSDYLALNWRRQDHLGAYVHYETIRERFRDLLETVSDGLRRRAGELVPLRAELTYVNLIEPNPLWSRPSELQGLLAMRLPDQDLHEAVALGYSKSLRRDDIWLGRMHVNLQSAYDMASADERLSVNLTSRTTDLAEPTLQGSLDFLDVAHEATNETFRSLMTPAALSIWGMT